MKTASIVVPLLVVASVVIWWVELIELDIVYLAIPILMPCAVLVAMIGISELLRR